MKCQAGCSEQVRSSAASDTVRPTVESGRAASALLTPREIRAASLGCLAEVQMPVLAAAVLPAALRSALASAGRAVATVTAAAHPAASTMIIGPRPLRIITAPSALNTARGLLRRVAALLAALASGLFQSPGAPESIAPIMGQPEGLLCGCLAGEPPISTKKSPGDVEIAVSAFVALDERALQAPG